MFTHNLPRRKRFVNELEPGVGFEPTWTFVGGLQNRCSRPLSDPGLW